MDVMEQRTSIDVAASPDQVRENARRMRTAIPDALWEELAGEQLVRAA